MKKYIQRFLVAVSTLVTAFSGISIAAAQPSPAFSSSASAQMLPSIPAPPAGLVDREVAANTDRLHKTLVRRGELSGNRQSIRGEHHAQEWLTRLKSGEVILPTGYNSRFFEDPNGGVIVHRYTRDEVALAITYFQTTPHGVSVKEIGVASDFDDDYVYLVDFAVY